MSYEPNKIEISKMNKVDIKKRYKYFIGKILGGGEVWGLKDKNGWALSVLDEKKCIPFWPAKVFAENCIAVGWESYYPESIPVENFRLTWLPGMAKDGLNVAVFPINGGKTAILVNPERLLFDINEEFDKYDWVEWEED